MKPMLMIPFSVWSNFEIGDLELWRGEAYSKFFEYVGIIYCSLKHFLILLSNSYLDEKGGFHYEVNSP